MKVALCCIAALENLYIRDFVEYYKNLGIDKIFIYDNNKLNGESFNEVINDYIKSEYVEIINYRGLKNCQYRAYNDCYSKHKNEYDWIAFFDCDEYLTLIKHKNIKEYLSDNIFNDTDIIHINWKCYSDNNLIHYENKPVIERFIEPSPLDFKRSHLDVPENYHVKSILKGNRKFLFVNNSHGPFTYNSNNYICKNNCGNIVDLYDFRILYNYDLAYIKHFVTKTIEEYINQKMKRGSIDNKDSSLINFNYFFEGNIKTKEKIDYINNIFDINYK